MGSDTAVPWVVPGPHGGAGWKSHATERAHGAADTLTLQMSSQVFCPRCGVARVGRLCTSCGYDYVEGARTPAITLSRGINWISLAVGIIAIAFLILVVAIGAQFASLGR